MRAASAARLPAAKHQISAQCSRPYSTKSAGASTPKRLSDVIVCGAGVAGLATAWQLIKKGVGHITVIDSRPPLSLTSSRSTECYRNWWPDSTMMAYVNRSIGILEELAVQSNNAFNLERPGYLFVSSDPGKKARFLELAKHAQEVGAGPMRYHEGGNGASQYVPSVPLRVSRGAREGVGWGLNGVDVFTDRAEILKHFKHLGLAEDICVAKHVRRCGWFDVEAYGKWIIGELERTRRVDFVTANVSNIVRDARGNFKEVEITAPSNSSEKRQLSAKNLVISAGPLLPSLAKQIGLQLPVLNEIHAKVVIKDRERILPRNAPLILYADNVPLPVSKAERHLLEKVPGMKDLIDGKFAGVHFRPLGGPDSDEIYGIWTYDTDVSPDFTDPPHIPPLYEEAVLRGMSRVLPKMKHYFGDLSHVNAHGFPASPAIKAVLGGFYTKAPDNRPIIGPATTDGKDNGIFICGALSGFGIMSSFGAGELAASYVCKKVDQPYAPAFLVSRFSDPNYKADPRAGQL